MPGRRQSTPDIQDEALGTPSSSPTKPVVPARTSSLAPRPLTALERTSSKRKVSWYSEYSNQSTESLQGTLVQLGKDTREHNKKLKRQVSLDARYWDSYHILSQMEQKKVAMESQIESRKFEASNPGKDWHNEEAAKTLEARFNRWKQIGTIVSEHRKRLAARWQTNREGWVRLFTTSNVGFGLEGAQGDRDNSDQSNMRKAMVAAYCPDGAEVEGDTWDPVLRRWDDSANHNAAHLFPWRHADSMDDIFGKGALKEIFTPVNGLFLNTRVEKALDAGLIAIVPDIDLEPANPLLPQDDQQERNQRVRDWESSTVKEYKVVVIRKDSKEVTKDSFSITRHGVSSLQDLHDRKLVFMTDARPRARYLWWVFMHSVIKTAWGQGWQKKHWNVQHLEVQKGTRYWGTRGRYVKDNQLLGLIEELGHDVKSILESTHETGDHQEEGEESKPSYKAMDALVHNVVESTRPVDEEDDDDDDDDDEEEELET